MFNHKFRRYFIVFFIFISILSIFIVSSVIEYKRELSEQKNDMQANIHVLTAEVNKFVNDSIRNANGLVAYIQTKPDLNQDDFSNYGSKILTDDNLIISHFTAIKDTTIAFVHPFEGNESAIGIDLADVEGQKEDTLRIKEDRISMFVGPVNLVQGGSALINRMPIVIDNVYWGQLSLVIHYDNMLEVAGVTKFSEDNSIEIRQLEGSMLDENLIFSNSDSFTEDSIQTMVDVPNGNWTIIAEHKDGFKGRTILFYMLQTLGFSFAIIISYLANYVMKTNRTLNKLVDKRTEDIRQKNLELEDSMAQLKSTQDQLVQREKHAALGELVAGVAHEINTPLGVCVTINSFIEELNFNNSKKLKNNTLKKSDLESGFERISESTSILSSNLDRATQLVLSFKKLATDQFLDEYRMLQLHEYMNYILKTISPTLKGTQHTITMDIDTSIHFMTYPSAIFQVLTNLIMNSIIHGFEGLEAGIIKVDAQLSDESVIIDYYDNGSGVPVDVKEKIFDPFFTTKRDEGSTGLGMHIVYNIVYQQLKGSIDLCDSTQGVHFKIRLPLEHNTNKD